MGIILLLNKRLGWGRGGGGIDQNLYIVIACSLLGKSVVTILRNRRAYSISVSMFQIDNSLCLLH